MIEKKEDYDAYLEADRIALGKGRKKPSIFGDEIWKFERLLRKAEYLNNGERNINLELFIGLQGGGFTTCL